VIGAARGAHGHAARGAHVVSARGAGSLLAAALAVLAMATLIIVLTPRPVTQLAVPVDYHPDLARFRQVAPYPVLAPRGLPPGWVPVSSRLTVVHGGAVSWHLGLMTPSGLMASLEESSERPGPFILRMTNNGDMLPPLWTGERGGEPGGEWWARRVRTDKDQRSMYRSAAGAFTIVVTGTGSWQELSVLARSLAVQR
jgi:uncharacterized protein DUF4245